jgi:hypothetical protein
MAGDDWTPPSHIFNDEELSHLCHNLYNIYITQNKSSFQTFQVKAAACKPGK